MIPTLLVIFQGINLIILALLLIQLKNINQSGTVFTSRLSLMEEEIELLRKRYHAIEGHATLVNNAIIDLKNKLFNKIDRKDE